MTSAGPRESCVSCNADVAADERSSNLLFFNANIDATLCVYLTLLIGGAALALTLNAVSGTLMLMAVIIGSGLLVSFTFVFGQGAKVASKETQEFFVSQTDTDTINVPLSEAATAVTPVTPCLVGPKLPVGAPHVSAESVSGWADLMAHMSHDLRTPLNAVIGFSYLMQNEAFGPLGSPRYQEYARHIQESGSALLKSTEDALVMTAALKSKSEAVFDARQIAGLKTVVEEAWQNVQNAGLCRGGNLTVDCPSDIEVYCDADLLQRAIFNLLAASARHCGQDAILSVAASIEQDVVQLEIATSEFNASEPLGSFSVSVARALLEVQGTSLLLLANETSGWRAVTVLDRVTQPDFFTTHHVDEFRCTQHRAA